MVSISMPGLTSVRPSINEALNRPIPHFVGGTVEIIPKWIPGGCQREISRIDVTLFPFRFTAIDDGHVGP
jgi:hypothetical protein